MTSDVPDGPEDRDDAAGAGDDSTTPDAEVDAEVDEASSTPKRKRKPMPIWQESILLLAVALGLAIVIKALFVQAFYIPSESMEPGLIRNDRILVEKVSYWFGREPQRGDVVVFKDPGEWLTAQDVQAPEGLAGVMSKIGLYPTGGHLVKRVIGTPGDVISCCDADGHILVNGEPIDEDGFLEDPGAGGCDAVLAPRLIQKGSDFAGACDWSIGPVPAGKLFVMGDNRQNSADSRAHLCAADEDPCTQSPWVDVDLVVGKVFTLVWPRDRWTWISRPEAFADVPDTPPADESSSGQAEQ